MGFRFRFRHSFTIIPKLLKLTINKKSWSINFHLGFYSRSWGSARSTSTIDAPGELGLSWRQEEAHGEGGFGGLFTLLMMTILLVQVVVQATHVFVVPRLTDMTVNHVWLLVPIFVTQWLLLWPLRSKWYVLPLAIVAACINWYVVTLLIVG